MSSESRIPATRIVDESFADARQRLKWWHVWNLPAQGRVYHASDVDRLLDTAQAEIDALHARIQSEAIRNRHS